MSTLTLDLFLCSLQRMSYSRMISTIGDGLCAILSEADERIQDPEEHLRIENSEQIPGPFARRSDIATDFISLPLQI